jgi:tRNA (guanine-N7-)-methyltransferase
VLVQPHRPYETTWEDWVLGGGARRAFVDPRLPLVVEIGPGEDDFLLEQARDRPDRNWLGIEYSSKRVSRYVRRLESRGVGRANCRMIWRPAGDLVEAFLSPGVVSTYHIHFPDPWPKKHHARYRLFAGPFAASLARSLVPDGEVVLATDSADYALEIHEGMSAAPGMRSVYPAPGWVTLPATGRATVFEERWRAMGREIHTLRYARV